MKERILIVDDQQDVADALARLVSALGYEAKSIYDGQRAIDAAAHFLPPFIFIDIGMPGVDGYEAVQRLRSRPECAHAILVALTGYTTREDRQLAYECGFD